MYSPTAEPIGAPAFDTHLPPPQEEADKCVHCGFCLPTCPTYLLWGEEMDSPRGRILLMKAGLDGRAPMTAEFVQHFDACLGCMACTTACPSGVDYGPLIERTRAQIERRFTRPPAEARFRRLLFSLLPYPVRLRIGAFALLPYGFVRNAVEGSGLFARLPGRVQALCRLAPSASLGSLMRRAPALAPAVGERRRRVGLLTGCVQRVFFRDVNDATTRVLAAEGCEVAAPAGQGCCGALALHAGYDEMAREHAKQLIATFEEAKVDQVVVNVAGCGSAMKEYGALFADDPAWAQRARDFSARVRDVHELLHELGPPRAVRHPLKARVAYHDACHLAHGQGVRRQPRELMSGIPGLDVVNIAEPEICCGSAGIYNLLQPEPAGELGDRKVGHIRSIQPDIIATANAGCLLQIAASQRRTGHVAPVLHPIQLIDASIQGTKVDRLLR